MKLILSGVYGARYLLVALALVVVFALPQIVRADPPRPRVAQTLDDNTDCVVAGNGGGYMFRIPVLGESLRITGISGDAMWWKAYYRGIPLWCQRDLLTYPRYIGWRR